jgi:hypothetical protein
MKERIKETDKQLKVSCSGVLEYYHKKTPESLRKRCKNWHKLQALMWFWHQR